MCIMINYCNIATQLYCAPLFMTDGQDPWDIRLNGGSSGELQVYLSEQWQPVANSYSTWMSNNSRVVCRELGFDPYHTG